MTTIELDNLLKDVDKEPDDDLIHLYYGQSSVPASTWVTACGLTLKTKPLVHCEHWGTPWGGEETCPGCGRKICLTCMLEAKFFSS